MQVGRLLPFIGDRWKVGLRPEQTYLFVLRSRGPRSDDWDRREGRRPRAHFRVADGRDCESEEPVRRDCTNDRGVAASAVGINRVEDNKRDAFAALLRRKRPSGLRRKGRPPRQVSAFTRTLRPAAKRLPDAGGRRSSHTSASEWATPTAAEPKDIRCCRRSLGRLSTLPVWADRRTAEPRRSMAERGRARAKPPRARLPLSSCRDSLRTLATSEARRLGAAFPHSITRRAGWRQEVSPTAAGRARVSAGCAYCAY